MLNLLLKGQRGFTLMELLVVVAILGVLTGIVSASVTGTKALSQDGQVQSDAKSAQTGVDHFNNKSIKSTFPEQGVSADHRYKTAVDIGAGGVGLGVVLIDRRGNPVGTLLSDKVKDVKTGKGLDTRTILDFGARVDMYADDGRIKQATFTPDFLLKEPPSTKLEADETKDLTANPFLEYLWVLKRNSPGASNESRTVEVYRLIEATCYSGGTDPNSVQGQAEAAFNNIIGTTTSTISTAYVGTGINIGGVNVLVSGHPSIRKAQADLTTQNDTVVTKRAELKAAQKALADAEAALIAAKATGVIGTTQDTRDAKAVLLTTAQGNLDAALATQAARQTDRRRARAILVAAQATAVINAKAAKAKCEGSNGVIELKYQGVSDVQAVVVKEGTAPVSATPTLTITATSLPSGTVGVAYNQTLQATGGTTPYIWSFASGSLSVGLLLHPATGVISGTPTAAGTFSFTTQVTDSSSPTQTATKTLSITVAPPVLPTALTFAKLVLGAGTQHSHGVGYDEALRRLWTADAELLQILAFDGVLEAAPNATLNPVFSFQPGFGDLQDMDYSNQLHLLYLGTGGSGLVVSYNDSGQEVDRFNPGVGYVRGVAAHEDLVWVNNDAGTVRQFRRLGTGNYQFLLQFQMGGCVSAPTTGYDPVRGLLWVNAWYNAGFCALNPETGVLVAGPFPGGPEPVGHSLTWGGGVLIEGTESGNPDGFRIWQIQ